MSKYINTTLLNKLKNNQVNNLITCWKLVLKDGTKVGFTEHVEDIVFEDENDVTYRSSSGYTPTNISTTSQYNVDNLDVKAVLGGINEADIMSGKYDYADVYIFQIDYTQKPYFLSNNIKYRKGILGEVKCSINTFVAEIRGLMQYLQNSIESFYQPACDAVFCDSRCKLNILDFTYTDLVINIENDKIITCENLIDFNTDDFNYGFVKFTSGLNNGVKYDIKKFTQFTTYQTIELQLKTNYVVNINDTFEIVLGCDKDKDTCKNTYNNYINFRGFPDVPGMDALTGGKTNG